MSVQPPAQVFISEHIPSPGATVVRDFTLFDVNTAPIQPTVGTISGFVLRADGTTPVADVPVYAWYRNRSQAAVRCPPQPFVEPEECTIAVTRTDAAGAFSFARIPSGELRLRSALHLPPTERRRRARLRISPFSTQRATIGDTKFCPARPAIWVRWLFASSPPYFCRTR